MVGDAKGSGALERVRAVGLSISSAEPTRGDLPVSVTLTEPHGELLGLRRHGHGSASEPCTPGRGIGIVDGDSVRILLVIVEHDSAGVERHQSNARGFRALPLAERGVIFWLDAEEVAWVNVGGGVA